jgi:chemotaxis protein MotB
MSRTTTLMLAVAALGTAACGVPEQKYKAAVAEADRSMREASEQKARAVSSEQRVGELSARLTQLEQAVTASSADAAQQRELATQLARTRELLESEKAATAAEADRQRQLAARLAEEKSALQQRSSEYESLAASLDQEIKAGRVQLTELQGKVTVRMAERVLFPSGSAVINSEGTRTLEKVAEAFKNVTGRIVRVEGHTDNMPIHTDRFPSNWELSAARAIAVVRYLQERGVDPAVLGAAGYAEFQPIASNDSPEGRAQNRRIEISLAAPPSAMSNPSRDVRFPPK